MLVEAKCGDYTEPAVNRYVMNYGKEVEDFVEHICCRSFFADFTFRSPEYLKQGRHKREAADVLVVFEDTLLAIQVKSKQVDVSSGDISTVDMNRIGSKLDESIQQFHALAEALKTPGFTSFKNGRGMRTDFDYKRIKNLVFMVVFAPIWKGSTKKPPRLRIIGDSHLKDDLLPVHLFTVNEFELLLKMLDTLPDFLAYLDARWFLHKERLIPSDSDPADEWAFVTFERDKFFEVFSTRKSTDLTGVMNRHDETIKVLERREKPSYLIDHLIETLYRTVASGRKIKGMFKAKWHLAPPNSLESLRLLVPHLARLNRHERTMLAEAFLDQIVKCFDNPPTHSQAMKFERHDEGFFILASTLKREERCKLAYESSIITGATFGVKRMICLTGKANGPVVALDEAMLIDLSDLEKEVDFKTVRADLQSIVNPYYRETKPWP